VRVLEAEAVEQHLRRPIRDEVVVAVGEETEVGGGAHEGAAEADLEAAHEVQAPGEERSGPAYQ
jgi:hypothetical protein